MKNVLIQFFFHAKFLYAILLCSVYLCNVSLYGQIDTLDISRSVFIEKAMHNLPLLDLLHAKYEIQKSVIKKVKGIKFLPQFSMNSSHSVIPGVSSDTDLSPNEYYLDPKLKNDWSQWGLFTQVNIDLLQPVFAWGALNKLMEASKNLTKANHEKLLLEQKNVKQSFFLVYEQMIMVGQLKQLFENALERVLDIKEGIQKEIKQNTNIDESNLYRLELIEHRVNDYVSEMEIEYDFLLNTMNYFIQDVDNHIYIPSQKELLQPQLPLLPLEYYENIVLNQHHDIKYAEYLHLAAKNELSSVYKKWLPSLSIGGFFSYAYAANRPRQINPFIINPVNTISGGVGLVINQNLNFFAFDAELSRTKAQRKSTYYGQKTAQQKILLNVREVYNKILKAEKKLLYGKKSYLTAQKWLRQEELDYDLGIGEEKDLFEAMQREFEFKIELIRLQFEVNRNFMALYHLCGLPIISLFLDS